MPFSSVSSFSHFEAPTRAFPLMYRFSFIKFFVVSFLLWAGALRPRDASLHAIFTCALPTNIFSLYSARFYSYSMNVFFFSFAGEELHDTTSRHDRTYLRVGKIFPYFRNGVVVPSFLFSLIFSFFSPNMRTYVIGARFKLIFCLSVSRFSSVPRYDTIAGSPFQEKEIFPFANYTRGHSNQFMKNRSDSAPTR